MWFSLQGEMSATVMYYPQKYLEMMDVVRAALLEGRTPDWGPNLKIGLQMNYNKLCACVDEDAIHPDFEASLAKAIALSLPDPPARPPTCKRPWCACCNQPGPFVLSKSALHTASPTQCTLLAGCFDITRGTTESQYGHSPGVTSWVVSSWAQSSCRRAHVVRSAARDGAPPAHEGRVMGRPRR